MSQATKHDSGKPRLELLPPNAIVELAKVMTEGAEKYGAHNYLGGMEHGRLIGAALRHIFKHLSGENIDELGTLHLANAAVDLLFVIEYMQRGIGTDDRYKESINLHYTPMVFPDGSVSEHLLTVGSALERSSKKCKCKSKEVDLGGC